MTVRISSNRLNHTSFHEQVALNQVNTLINNPSSDHDQDQAQVQFSFQNIAIETSLRISHIFTIESSSHQHALRGQVSMRIHP